MKFRFYRDGYRERKKPEWIKDIETRRKNGGFFDLSKKQKRKNVYGEPFNIDGEYVQKETTASEAVDGMKARWRGILGLDGDL